MDLLVFAHPRTLFVDVKPRGRTMWHYGPICDVRYREHWDTWEWLVPLPSDRSFGIPRRLCDSYGSVGCCRWANLDRPTDWRYYGWIEWRRWSGLVVQSHPSMPDQAQNLKLPRWKSNQRVSEPNQKVGRSKQVRPRTKNDVRISSCSIWARKCHTKEAIWPKRAEKRCKSFC